MKIVIFISLVAIYSCNHVSNPRNQFEKIVLIDTTNIIKTNERHWIEGMAAYYPNYIGSSEDSIILNHDFKKRYETYSNRFPKPDSNQILIFVDTSRTTFNVSPIPAPPPIGTDYETYKPRKQGVEGYPVFIKNLYSDTIEIGYSIAISLVMEAQNSEGSWRSIEKPYTLFCGTGVNGIFLPPSDIVITTTKIPKGGFKTKLRLRFDGKNPNYSNEFSGFINE